MRITTVTFFIFLVAITCNEKGIELSFDETNEIERLESDAQKSLYLYKLWQQDQNFRGGEGSEVLLKYGRNSKEHKEWNRQFKTNDNEVFQKLEYYLKNHVIQLILPNMMN